MSAVLGYWQAFLNATITTLWVSWLALILGGIIGAAVGHARLSHSRVVRWIALGYTELFRSIPPLLLFAGVHYGLAYTFEVRLTPFQSATLALTLVASSLMAEVVRAAIESVSRGQRLAALASAMRPIQVMYYVVWPQAIRVLVPAATGVYITTLKDSSYASVITYLELTRTTLLVREATGKSFEALMVAAVIYFVLTYGISRLGALVERKFHFVH
jgi:His/Glu/Gln/Arg/opine family amino acid ABC transporter permease subunit